MRNLLDPEVGQFRVIDDKVVQRFGWAGDGTCGFFSVPSPIDHATMMVVASSGFGWDHVSVSRRKRCPNWTEMKYIKCLFFYPSDVVMQLHVAESDHIDVHHNCLHLWRPRNATIPLPPAEMVA